MGEYEERREEEEEEEKEREEDKQREKQRYWGWEAAVVRYLRKNDLNGRTLCLFQVQSEVTTKICLKSCLNRP